MAVFCGKLVMITDEGEGRSLFISPIEEITEFFGSLLKRHCNEKEVKRLFNFILSKSMEDDSFYSICI